MRRVARLQDFVEWPAVATTGFAVWARVRHAIKQTALAGGTRISDTARFARGTTCSSVRDCVSLQNNTCGSDAELRVT